MAYVWPLNDGFKPGQSIKINGAFTHCSNRFDVNLQVGDACHVRTIPLHISLRQSQGTIVLNTMQCGNWLHEQVHPLPIHQGAPFEMLIVFEPAHFRLEIDGQHIGDYCHRMSATCINQLNVTEGVTLTLISLEAKNSSYCKPLIDER